MPEENTLSAREEEILQLVATGMSNREIAQELYISPNTVKVHMRNIFEKLSVSSRTEATLYGIEQGIVDVPGGGNQVESIPQPTWQEVIRKFTWVWVGVGLILLVFLVTFSSNVLFPSPTQEAMAAVDVADRWQELAPMPEPRAKMATAAYDGNIYTIAGAGPDGVSGSVFRYLTADDVWERLSDKPTPVSEVDGVLIGEKIYVPGGKLGNGQPTDVLEIYDPRWDTWEKGEPLPMAISAYALADFEGQMYLFGGWDGENALDIALRYDPQDDDWQYVTPMPTARAYAGAAEAGGKIYVVGGWDGRKSLNVNESYMPARDRLGEDAWEKLDQIEDSFKAYNVHSLSEIIIVIGKDGFLYYSLQNDRWNYFASDPGLPIYNNIAISSLEGYLFIIGGRDENGLFYNNNTRYQATYTIAIPQIIN